MLTKEQVDQLFVFCEKHFVRHYDMQVELVDHLANAIEDKMRSDNSLSFERATESVHADFGPLGFAGVVNSRTRMLNQKYGKMKKELFLSYFQWPKAAMTACLISALLFIGKILPNEIIYYLMCIAFACLYIFDLYILRSATRAIKKQKHKLMITDIGLQQSGMIMFGAGFLSGMIHYEDILDKSRQPILYIGYGLFIVLIVGAFFALIAYQKVIIATQEVARKEYPEAFGL